MKVRHVLESNCPVFFTMLSWKDLVMLEHPVKMLILQGKEFKDSETGLAAFEHLDFPDTLVRKAHPCLGIEGSQ